MGSHIEYQSWYWYAFGIAFLTPLFALSYVLVFVVILTSPLSFMVVLSLPKKLVPERWISSRPSKLAGIAGIYQQAKYKDSVAQRLLKGSMGLAAQAGLLLSVWLYLNVSVPRLKTLTLLGSPMWRWSLLAVMISCSFFVAMAIYAVPLLAHLPLQELSRDFHNALKRCPQRGCRQVLENKNDYPARDLNGKMLMSWSIVLYFGIVLVSWLSYFRTEHGLKSASIPQPEAFEYVTWTCVSLFVGSILWLIKNAFLLMWSANVIYCRFQPRILITAAKFSYLSLTMDTSAKFSFLSPIMDNNRFDRHRLIRPDLKLLREYERQWRLSCDEDEMTTTTFNFTNHIMSQSMDITYLLRVSRFLSSLATGLGPLKDDGVPDIVDLLQNKMPQTDDTCTIGFLSHNLLSGDDEIATVLHGLVREQTSSEFTFDDLKKWMVDAHKNCVNMGHTLADTRAIVTSLDMFISFVILLLVVLLWLLITGFATTKVLVTIATPLLALTFIFGDTAKSFFQGIVFCFATHAFDVGDRCILDETKLEVKSISILTTTFFKIGTMEKIMYPNSVLATKAIVNLGWQPDPSDVVELTLDSSTTSTGFQEFEAKIQRFFSDSARKGYFEKSHNVIMKETGVTKKVTIQFTHVLNVNEMTHGQCMHKKNKQRSIFMKKINQFLDLESPTTPQNGHCRGSMNIASSQVGLEPILTTHKTSYNMELID